MIQIRMGLRQQPQDGKSQEPPLSPKPTLPHDYSSCHRLIFGFHQRSSNIQQKCPRFYIYNTSKLSDAGLCCLSFVPHDTNVLISFMVAAVSNGNYSDYLNNGLQFKNFIGWLDCSYSKRKSVMILVGKVEQWNNYLCWKIHQFFSGNMIERRRLIRNLLLCFALYCGYLYHFYYYLT